MNEIAEQAFELYNEGMQNRDLGFPELTISSFDKAINLIPNNYLFYAQRGFAKRDLKYLVEALTDFVWRCL